MDVLDWNVCVAPGRAPFYSTEQNITTRRVRRATRTPASAHPEPDTSRHRTQVEHPYLNIPGFLPAQRRAYGLQRDSDRQRHRSTRRASLGSEDNLQTTRNKPGAALMIASGNAAGATPAPCQVASTP